MDQNIMEYATKAVGALKGDAGLLSQFTANPVKILEQILGVDLPDEIVGKVIEAVKSQLSGGVADAAKEAVSALSGAADAATGAVSGAADAAADKAKEGGSILGSAIDAIKKIF